MDHADEECDDGNTNSLDGCTEDCKLEPGFKCPTPGDYCECDDQFYMVGINCLACDVSCNGCTGPGNDKCKACSTSGATKYYLHAGTGKCLE